MDLGSILAMAQRQPSSVPGLLQMLRGGDPQGVGGPRGEPQQGAAPQGAAPQGAGAQSQLQMAQAAMGEDWTDNTKWPGLTRTEPGQFQAWQYEPGTYIRGGQIISPDKFYQDTHRPVDTQEGGGIVGGSLLPYRGFNNANAWSTKGQVGYFGQTGPWGTSWGSGGP